VPEVDDAWISQFYALVGDKVRSARLTADISQALLAKRVGLTRSSIANLEAGRQRIALHLLVLIAQALNAEVQEILTTLPESGEARAFPELQQHLADSPETAKDFVHGAVARLISGPGKRGDDGPII
jgi:transcriptional regulator with XRE-family HTH domain